MNDLDRQLAELALMNQTELQPNSSSTPGKKIGPAVPPKPKKSQQPQIPQSYPLKQTVEPSYSSRLQANQFYSNVPPPNPQSHYSNTPTLPVNTKYRPQHIQDSNYVNLARESDHAHQYSNVPRSGSAMSSASHPRQGSAMTNYGSSLPPACSLSRQGMSSAATGSNHSVNSYGPKGYAKPDHVTYSNIQMVQSRNPDGIIYSNLIHPPRDGGNVYSNASAFGNGDDLPPPPPPLDMTSGLADYAPCTVNTNLPPPPEDLLPPPSPVSSSYSELRRATQPGQDFHNYSMESQYEDTDSLYGCGSMSQSHSAYEPVYDPVYEPILFSSSSGISSRHYYSSVNSNYSSNDSPHEPVSLLTSRIDSLLMQRSSSDENFYEPIEVKPEVPRHKSLSEPCSSVGQGSHEPIEVKPVVPRHKSSSGPCSSLKEASYEPIERKPESKRRKRRPPPPVPGSSSTYESIYEPINPRPPSQMSSRSNYSLYAPYVSGASSTMTGPSQSVSRIGHNKEQEVDSLTDLLVQGMGGVGPDTDQEDVYGVCVKCGEKIVGENSGCTAMDQLYHTTCFTCHHCAINLQGKPFYALDGNPYCEEDYLNTLEKCCVCQKPILDRILRATGKPYHPRCFCCVVCGKSLDGIPFTVDATNRVHCIEDFHKIFAPRCWVCKQPIMPEPGEEETVRVVALDHSFHIQCYKCEDCGLVLSSEAEGRGCYPLDGHVLCKSCNAKRVQALTSHMTTEL